MNKLYQAFLAKQTVEAANKVMAYLNKHPMTACLWAAETSHVEQFLNQKSV